MPEVVTKRVYDKPKCTFVFIHIYCTSVIKYLFFERENSRSVFVCHNKCYLNSYYQLMMRILKLQQLNLENHWVFDTHLNECKFRDKEYFTSTILF